MKIRFPDFSCGSLFGGQHFGGPGRDFTAYQNVADQQRRAGVKLTHNIRFQSCGRHPVGWSMCSLGQF